MTCSDHPPIRIPPALRWSGLVFLCIHIPLYTLEYGPRNFLWFSNIALFGTVLGMWLRSRLLISMMTLAVLIPETAWTVDFALRLIGYELTGLTRYMFDRNIPLAIRAISLFHIPLPIVLFWLVREMGYDRRALIGQTLLAWCVLPLTYWLTDPGKNVNRVFGPGVERQQWMPAEAYLVLLMVAVPLIIYLPAHLLLSWVNSGRRAASCA